MASSLARKQHLGRRSLQVLLNMQTWSESVIFIINMWILIWQNTSLTCMCMLTFFQPNFCAFFSIRDGSMIRHYLVTRGWPNRVWLAVVLKKLKAEIKLSDLLNPGVLWFYEEGKEEGIYGTWMILIQVALAKVYKVYKIAWNSIITIQNFSSKQFTSNVN